MIIGVPKEIKNSEFRVGLTPKSVAEITSKGHEVFVENNSGLEIGYTNKNYENSGAKITVSYTHLTLPTKRIV